MTIRAVYQNGVLRPLKPLQIAEGTEVDVTVSPPRVAPSPEIVRERLLKIADMPLENGQPFSGEDHDKMLYGEKPE
jgi:predicted DNA-binding antitoxin AbrB/MazE fold protein